jgi:hypothetical protein
VLGRRVRCTLVRGALDDASASTFPDEPAAIIDELARESDPASTSQFPQDGLPLVLRGALASLSSHILPTSDIACRSDRGSQDAHHLNRRGGVLIGDVVGLGKTLMATALARIFEDDHGLETLIICPKNLVSMWDDYRAQYRLRATIVPISQAVARLADLPRHRLVLVDESHNLRNREGQRYRAIRDYIERNESKVILLSATPYNKTFVDLSNQLRLFVREDAQLPVRPEELLRSIGESEFIRRHQCRPDSLAGFEKSEYADDWRELMRLYLVRRTRSFIQDNYAETDADNGRRYVTFEDGTRSYFPSPPHWS